MKCGVVQCRAVIAVIEASVPGCDWKAKWPGGQAVARHEEGYWQGRRRDTDMEGGGPMARKEEGYWQPGKGLLASRVDQEYL